MATGRGRDVSQPVDNLKEDPLDGLTFFGDYEILQELGRGGMGRVFKVRHLRLKTILALKVIRTDYLDSDEAVERFRSEATAAARLDHPNVIRIYEAGELEGRQYFSMRYVEGGSLADPGVRCRFEKQPRAIASLVAKIARGLDHVHHRYILHRDLKPSNILVGEDGEPVITDFGIAKLLDRSSAMTRTGRQPGTRPYMAPERIDGRRAPSPAMDVWSLGVILYELLAGRRPFEGKTDFETDQMVLSEEPPRLTTVSKVDRNLQWICEKCLRKEPQHRYPSAMELAEDLERWLRGETPVARPLPIWLRAWLAARRHPYKTASVALAAMVPFFGCLVAGYYTSRLAYLADEEGPVFPLGSLHVINTNGRVWRLPLSPSRFGDRCTPNLWSEAFRDSGHPSAQVRFLNLGDGAGAWAGNLVCRLKADYPGLPDQYLSPPLTNGQIFAVPALGRLARNYYFAPVGWDLAWVSQAAPGALIEFALLPTTE